MSRSDVGVDELLASRAGMGNRPITGRPHRLRKLPKRAGSISRGTGLEMTRARFEFDRIDLEIDCAGVSVDTDDVAVLNEGDGTTGLGLGTHVPNTQTAGGA